MTLIDRIIGRIERLTLAATAAATTNVFERWSEERGALLCNNGTQVTLKLSEGEETAPIACTLETDPRKQYLYIKGTEFQFKIPTSKDEKLYLGTHAGEYFVLSPERDAPSFVPVAEITKGDGRNSPFRMNSISLDTLEVTRPIEGQYGLGLGPPEEICGGYRGYGNTFVINPFPRDTVGAVKFTFNPKREDKIALQYGSIERGVFKPSSINPPQYLELNKDEPTPVGRTQWLELGCPAILVPSISNQCVLLAIKNGQLLVAVTSSHPVEVSYNSNQA